jgi:S-adenosylmethionine:tRNA ribosyltransferase-isomerase
MNAAAWRRDNARATRLMVVDPGTGEVTVRSIVDLALLLDPGELLVVNDAATLPASLAGATGRGDRLEARLVGLNDDGTWRAVLFGDGDWRNRTEDRSAPPAADVDERIAFGALLARVAAVDSETSRLVTLDFGPLDARFWRALYGAGRPIQYSYTSRPFALWDVQTLYAGRPWAVEAPSAGFALTWDLLLALRRRGVNLARVTHAAGISSTGDESIDARLPFAERFEVPDETARLVRETKARGGRVIALGTTVARALESAARLGGGICVAASGVTDLLLGPDSVPAVVDALLSGMHEPGTSHYRLLQALAPLEILDRAHALAEAAGFLGHEFGDAVLIARGRETLAVPGFVSGSLTASDPRATRESRAL